jgi:hypothetical protein
MKSLIIAEGDSSPKMFKLKTHSRQHKQKATIQEQVENAYVRLAYLNTFY